MELNKRQTKILEIVKYNGPITGEQIAERLDLARATIRPDLAILTMAGFLDARPRVGYFYSGKKIAQSMADGMVDMKVGDFQSIPVVVNENMSVYDAICQMFLEDVGTLFVVDDHHCLAGVLSNITRCSKHDSLLQVAKKMIDNQIDALPVTEQGEKGLEVIGRITKTNITGAFVALGEEYDL